MASIDEFIRKQFNIPIDMPKIELDPEKWIWIDGYKGTDANMCCRGYQYELGKQFDMPEDAQIKDCESGFHLCKDLKDVFPYYDIGNDNRFFQVRALVREKDYNEYCKFGKSIYEMITRRNKLSAKSIEFVHELDMNELFKVRDYGYGSNDWTDEEKREAMSTSLEQVRDRLRKIERTRQTEKLVSLGYSRAFAGYLTENDKYDDAVAVASQPDLSMDMKCLIIFRNDL